MWSKVERIHVGEKSFRYAESPATCDIVLCHQEFKITTGSESHTLPSVEEFSDSHYCKAKSLCNYTAYVPSLEAGKPFPKIIQRERAGKDVTESDSGDEQVPDHPCVPPFSAEELPVVQEKYHAFWTATSRLWQWGFRMPWESVLWKNYSLMHSCVQKSKVHDSYPSKALPLDLHNQVPQ